MNNDINQLIEKLTHNYQYANDVCLLLYINDCYTSLYYLDYLNITGKEIENLYACCNNTSIEYLTQTIRFLRSGYLSNEEIKENLNTPNPKPFITRLMNINEDWDRVYEEYAGLFRQNNNKQNKR